MELDLPVGRHDGTVQGVRYFAAAPDAGIFVTESKLTKFTAASAPMPPATASKPAPPPAAARSPRRATAGLGRSASVRVSSSTRRAPPGGGRTRDDSAVVGDSSRPGSAAGSSVRARNPLAARTPAQAKEDGWQTVSVQQFSRFRKSVPKKYLEVGTSAICVHSKEMGVVRFVGRVDFSGGIWAGVELREPREGRHDGHVKGKRWVWMLNGVSASEMPLVGRPDVNGLPSNTIQLSSLPQVLHLQAGPRGADQAQAPLRARDQRGEAAQAGERVPLLTDERRCPN